MSTIPRSSSTELRPWCDFKKQVIDGILKMVKQQKVMTENRCPVCETSQDVFYLCDANSFAVYGCKACGAEYVFPMPDKQFLKAYYDREEWFEGGEIGGYHNYDQQTAWSVDAIDPILGDFRDTRDLSILDVGCGYGSHLALAASRGWKCFGVEVSDYARRIAKARLEGKAQIVETVSDLVPHEFDLILMLDVIEHLPTPYPLFYNLFSIGAITPTTRIVISTPNAGSYEARRNPADWPYRHPPSHLVYYSAESLRFLLEKLHFTRIHLRGVYPLRQESHWEGEIAGYGGLTVSASGSDFTEFMRERYVPGTWSKIAEYEHLPRYAFARASAAGKVVLDFGCGTGYGAAALADVAASVTGLDIDQSAISWANATHRNPRLTFHRCSDLGGSLPGASFDIVTCFEMIEHVDYETQRAVIASIARLLKDSGLLFISTPNPEITKLYGDNPYHVREMTLQEFYDLLGDYFPYIRIFKQRVSNSITFGEVSDGPDQFIRVLGQGNGGPTPLAFIAVCSNKPIDDHGALVAFDHETDVIQDYLTSERRLNEIQFEKYRQVEKSNYLMAAIGEKDTAVASQAQEIRRLSEVVSEKDTAVASQAQEIRRLSEVVSEKDTAVASQAQEIRRLS
ncbi:MAG: methyltransferase domain-containing protein, partial [Burkholderiales bacterium]|nr:methyltransferase domain-containing protein [Burkholderiales bacterium]